MVVAVVVVSVLMLDLIAAAIVNVVVITDLVVQINLISILENTL